MWYTIGSEKEYEMEQMSAEKLANIYIKIRDAKQAEEEKMKAKLSEFQEQLDLISEQLLELCKDQNATSIKTESGTIIRKISTRYWSTDWESMHAFIKKHDALGLLEQRLHQANMKQFLEENPELMPPGVQVDRKYTVVVRRS
jgi:flagellar biosynthesis chaperone FliJ